MKKWSGGVLIIGLGFVLLLRYSFMVKQPLKQSAYDFFNNHPSKDTNVKGENEVKSGQMKAVNIYSNGKRPYFKNFEGLDDLYASTNLSTEESKVLLVWAQLRTLLSRSDALPETTIGIKEAAIAWKDLLTLVEKDSNPKSNVIEKNCQYSVSALNELNEVINGSRNVLEIPCGMVEDSSVTLIGIPNRGQGSFQIELVGARSPEEQNPPIVLHYNVFLPGENLTKEPVIVQNTWIKEIGWGKKECCPDHRSSNTVKGTLCVWMASCCSILCNFSYATKPSLAYFFFGN